MKKPQSFTDLEYSMRKFIGLDFKTESVPDATTLCKCCKLINDNGLGERYFAACREFLEERSRKYQ